jgi:hypothetical protein
VSIQNVVSGRKETLEQDLYCFRLMSKTVEPWFAMFPTSACGVRLLALADSRSLSGESPCGPLGYSYVIFFHLDT